MIKRVATSELRIGMYVHDLTRGWWNHPFAKNQFTIDTEQVIQKIANAGVRYVFIDTERGKNVEETDYPCPVPKPHAQHSPTKKARVPAIAEMANARNLYRETTSVVRNLMEGARSGRQVKIAAVYPLAERMVQSVLRNPHAITSVARIKNTDEYTFMHCVSVSALLVAFAHELDLPDEQIQEVAVGGLMHDIGKTLVPQDVLNKPAKLTNDEFAQIKQHVPLGEALLRQVPDLSDCARDVASLHHERMDGQGYPGGLKGENINLIGRMSAIVDVYDALTSERIYKSAWQPTLAIKNLFESSPAQFDSALVQQFASCIGIYPVGSMVALESGLVGIVIEQADDLLRPTIRIVYNRKHLRYERVRDVSLRTSDNDKIVEAIAPQSLGIDCEVFF